MVNAPSSGVTYVSSTASRTPRSRRYQSARKQNSSGATGHLIGMSTGLITSRPRSKRRSASRSAVADSSSKKVKIRSPHPGPVSPSVSSGSSDAPDATTSTS